MPLSSLPSSAVDEPDKLQDFIYAAVDAHVGDIRRVRYGVEMGHLRTIVLVLPHDPEELHVLQYIRLVR